MKRILGVLAVAVLLCGCGADKDMEEALEARSRMLEGECSFRCHITADYIEYMEQFSLDCTARQDGTVDFSVVQPESICGISGTVEQTEGTVEFEDLILGFPLMADERLSPVASPWLLVKALRSGFITAAVREGELLHLTVDDSYAEDALTLEVWLDKNDCVTACEIGWKGRRVVSMIVEGFAYL